MAYTPERLGVIRMADKQIPDFAAYCEKCRTSRVTKRALAKKLRISRPALDRMIADYEGNFDI